MFSLIRRAVSSFLSRFEDPMYPSVAPNLRILTFVGIWCPNLNSRATQFKQYLFYFTVIFFCSEYVKCCIQFDAESIKRILQYSPFHMGIIKSCLFKKDYKKWEKLVNYVSSTEREQILNNDKKHVVIIKRYIRQCRIITYSFVIMSFLTNLGIYTEPYRNNYVNENGTSVYLIIFDAYTPFSREPPWYYVSMAIQTSLGYVVSGYVIGWDMLVVTIMIFLAGQLKITRENCKRMMTQNVGESHENIVKYHREHVRFIKYQQLFNLLLSQTMFFYLIIISVNLGVCIIQIAQLQNDVATLLTNIQYMIACLVQLLLFYWHANEVTEESVLVSYSTFESEWTGMDLEVQKELILLGVTTNKKLVFNAGPFSTMSLSTFIGILRGSYSFYTLLSETK